MKLACDLLLFFLAILVPMAGIAWAVIRLGTPTAPAPLCLRPKPCGAAKSGGWTRRILRVLLMLALAAACAWLMTGCAEQARPGWLAVLGLLGLLRLLLAIAMTWLGRPADNDEPAGDDPLLAGGLPPGLNDCELARILAAAVDELREARGQAAAVRLCLRRSDASGADMASPDVRAALDASTGLLDRLVEALEAVEARHSLVIGCLEGLRTAAIHAAADAEDARCRAENAAQQRLNQDLSAGVIAG